MTRHRLKTYEELTFADDFMFCKILQDDVSLAKELLELILDHPIEDIKLISSQHTVLGHSDARSVRFDVYIHDQSRKRYDIEMQTLSNPELPQRSRYYSGMMDQEILDRGSSYRELPETFVIFICTFNVFGNGDLYKYTFENLCLEDPSLHLNDGTHKIFLCTTGRSGVDEISPKLRNFLSYVSGQEAKDRFTEKLQSAVQKAKGRGRWRDEYMFWYEHEELAREAGREEGREEGIRQGIFALIKAMRGLSAADEQIIQVLCDDFSLSEDEARAQLENWNENQH